MEDVVKHFQDIMAPRIAADAPTPVIPKAVLVPLDVVIHCVEQFLKISTHLHNKEIVCCSLIIMALCINVLTYPCS